MASFFCNTLVFFFLGFVELGNARYVTGFQRKQQKMNYKTVYVDPSGHGQFKTIQSAIDSVPQNNQNWICINIKAGQYRYLFTVLIYVLLFFRFKLHALTIYRIFALRQTKHPAFSQDSGNDRTPRGVM